MVFKKKLASSLCARGKMLGCVDGSAQARLVKCLVTFMGVAAGKQLGCVDGSRQATRGTGKMLGYVGGQKKLGCVDGSTQAWGDKLLGCVTPELERGLSKLFFFSPNQTRWRNLMIDCI